MVAIETAYSATGIRWDTLFVEISRKNAFGAVPLAVVTRPEAVYILAGSSLWTGGGDCFTSRPSPVAQPLTQVPLCIGGGVLVTFNAQE